MSKPETQILYNAECPVCRFEITHYATYAAREKLPLRFEPLDSPVLQEHGLTADEGARRLHVIRDGQVLSGLDAFVALWEEMPRFAWMARLVRLPMLNRLMRVVYDEIAAPLLYRAHLRRVEEKSASKQKS